MNLRQLRFLQQIVECGLNFSTAAAALHTSQPSVSRQIRDLEEELGVLIFRRSKRRILGVTPAGAEVLKLAQSMSRQALDLKRIKNDFPFTGNGDLTIAASHTHARYSLPDIIEKFMKMHPQVHLMLRQGDPESIARLVQSGEADLLISSKPVHPPPDILFLPWRRVARVILAPKKYRAPRTRPLTLNELARYPLIMYDRNFEVDAQVMRAFAEKKLTPNVVLTATDVDVMKTYVKRGLGLAIVGATAYDPKEDRLLRMINAQHLFPEFEINIGVRKNSYVPPYVYDFISLVAPQLTRAVIERALFRV